MTGYIFVVVPKHDALPSDRTRPVTSIQELIIHRNSGSEAAARARIVADASNLSDWVSRTPTSLRSPVTDPRRSAALLPEVTPVVKSGVSLVMSKRRVTV